MNQVTRVIDSYGRTIDYAYYGAEFGYRLRQITDFLGRQLKSLSEYRLREGDRHLLLSSTGLTGARGLRKRSQSPAVLG